MDRNIMHFESLPSTNDELKRLAEEGAAEGTVLIADEQTAGKGRQGRSFFSPKDTGIYMSILLRPSLAPKDSLFITTAAAVAVTKAIRKVTDLDARIKWVNDIYIADRKICGILAEAALDNSGGLRYVVLGIGINVATPKAGFPAEIEDIAGALEGNGVSEAKRDSAAGHDAAGETSDSARGSSSLRRLLADAVLDEFECLYDSFAESNFDKSYVTEQYRSMSAVIGRDILVLDEGGPVRAHADDIDDDCRLIVTLEDGTRRILSSGEISIRLA